MALLCRIKQATLNPFSIHLRRFYYRIPVPSLTNQEPSKGITNFSYNNIIKLRDICICPKPVPLFGNNVRFFAVPIQFQKKVEVKEPTGLRLNEKIKAEFVRLVTDDGHYVVSRHEALEHAKRENLDLVEVDRQANPPVCKIMDYNKETYIRKVKAKERAKIKAQGSLKGGDCKEVRFSAKSELKDLKMKADMAKRLMERGYRVKCMAVGTEDQNLGGLLSQISAMIEDVALVETGPNVEKKQAYIMVRHVKFGLPKKGGRRASKVDGAASFENQRAASASEDLEEETLSEDSDVDSDDADALSQGPEESMRSVSDSSHNFDKVFDHNNDVRGSISYASPAANNKAARFPQSRLPNLRTPNAGPSVQETENRYARNMKNNAPNRQFGPPNNFSAPVGRSGPATSAGGHSSQTFGIFSASKVDAHGKHGSGVEGNQHSSGNPFDVRRNLSPDNPANVKSKGSRGSGADDSGKYGIFSGKNSKSTPGRS